LSELYAPFSNSRGLQLDIFTVKYVITVTGFILLYQDNIKTCVYGNIFKLKYEYLRQGTRILNQVFFSALTNSLFKRNISS